MQCVQTACDATGYVECVNCFTLQGAPAVVTGHAELNVGLTALYHYKCFVRLSLIHTANIFNGCINQVTCWK